MTAALYDLLNTILTNFIPIISSVITLVLLPKVEAWLRIAADDKRRAAVETALTNGLRLALTSLTKQVFPSASEINSIRDEAIRVAAEYVKAAVPNTLVSLGVSDKHLLSLLESRLPTVIDSIIADLEE